VSAGEQGVNFKGGKPNHTYFREFNMNKFFLGFPLAYLVLRDLPLRNFYARCVVMCALYAKYMDNQTGLLPYISDSRVVLAEDPWDHLDTAKQFTVLEQVNNGMVPPNKNNRLAESESWYNRQPGHMVYTDHKCLMTIPLFFSRKYREVPWDGTFSQPLMRLADPLHKDTKFVHFA
jgi:hypothetical protein